MSLTGKYSTPPSQICPLKTKSLNYAGDGSRAYLVMEYIDIHHFASDEERAKALAEMIAIEPPPGVFGNFGPPGRYIRHMFFKEREAAKMYSSVQELQDSINRVSPRAPCLRC